MSQVIPFDVVVEASAGVRKCEPFTKVTDCPACGTVKVVKRGWFFIRVLDHVKGKPEVEADTFIARTCRSCGFVWRQFK